MEEMPHGKIETAVTYASSSNGLENNDLTEQEVATIIKGLEESKSDESFLFSVVKLVKKYKPGEEQNKGELGYGKNRWSIKLSITLY